ncbi:polysaccharide biosynthesis/export family protein [Caldimonas sp. KR1-144]|uniref:polysaccharide biosynthesis/export family protein n=1 Tax=Caldimonas sp. KR1-144 TaxID=3400911 RepID=UPI003C004AF7
MSPHATPRSPAMRVRALAALILAVGSMFGLPVSAQITNSTGSYPYGTSPRGMTEIPTTQPVRDPKALIDAEARARAAQGTAGAAVVPGMNPQPLPPDPATSLKPLMFGSQMFSGRFAATAFSGFNPDQQIAVGDRISVRMWGAFNFEATQVVDAQGNVFVPNVGPVNVLGVRNADLNGIIEIQVKKTYRASVGVYATLEAAQPVKIYVTGFVRAPGLYGGLSSDSVIAYLDRAGGIDPDRGSYVEVDVLRAGKPYAKVNLYDFLLNGRIESLQLHDGDTLVVAPRKFTVTVGGEVLNPYIFEFGRPAVTGEELLAVARPRPGATHLSVVRKLGADHRSEYHAISEAAAVTIQDGDEVTVTSDKYPGTILVRIEGSHLGERTLVLPYGSHLKDALARIRPAPQSRLEAIQLFRKSVATRQKDLIEASLRSLETYALTARSATSEEAALRSREGQQILEFIDRARQVQPRGQVILGQNGDVGNTLLEDGDVLRIPAQSNLVLVSGEVLMPTALVFDARASVDDYIARSGGYTQGADKAKVLVVRQDGTVVMGTQVALAPGDELMVLPKIETKSVEITRGITQIIYQIAVAAKVLFDL